MTGWSWTSPQRRPWPRLLAWLLVMAFAFAVLPGHATTDACQVECAQLQADMPAPDAPCGATCAAPVASLSPAVMAPRLPTAAVVTLVSDHVPQPPRRPPRA